MTTFGYVRLIANAVGLGVTGSALYHAATAQWWPAGAEALTAAGVFAVWNRKGDRERSWPPDDQDGGPDPGGGTGVPQPV